MSLGEDDASFPGQSSNAIPPSPCPENPGQVYPKYDPIAAPAETIPGTGGEEEPSVLHILGNPYALHDLLEKLDSALTDAIETIENEEDSVGMSGVGETLRRKFVGWRDELVGLRSGGKLRASSTGAGTASADQEGGMFTD